jgi:hypothetical protein
MPYINEVLNHMKSGNHIHCNSGVSQVFNQNHALSFLIFLFLERDLQIYAILLKKFKLRYLQSWKQVRVERVNVSKLEI